MRLRLIGMGGDLVGAGRSPPRAPRSAPHPGRASGRGVAAALAARSWIRRRASRCRPARRRRRRPTPARTAGPGAATRARAAPPWWPADGKGHGRAPSGSGRGRRGHLRARQTLGGACELSRVLGGEAGQPAGGCHDAMTGVTRSQGPGSGGLARMESCPWRAIVHMASDPRAGPQTSEMNWVPCPGGPPRRGGAARAGRRAGGRSGEWRRSAGRGVAGQPGAAALRSCAAGGPSGHRPSPRSRSRPASSTVAATPMNARS
jgi:hypothetical protein